MESMTFSKDCIEKINQLLIFLLIASVVGGNYLAAFNFAGIEMYAFRFLLVLSLIYLLFTKQFRFYTSNFTKKVFIILLFWLFYALLSLFWTPDLLYGIKDIFYISVGIICYIVLLSISQNWKLFETSIELSWNAVYCCVFLFSFFEIFTGMHLQGAFLDNLNHLGYFHYANNIPIVSFVSQNIFAIYLCITIVLATYFLKISTRKYVNGFVLISALILLQFTESRFGTLFLVVFYTFLVLTYLVQIFVRKEIKIFTKPNLIVAGVFIISFGVFYGSFLSFFNLKSFENYGNTTIEQYDSNGNNIGSKVIDKNALLIVSDVEKDTNLSYLPNKIFIIEEQSFQKMLNGKEQQLTIIDVPKNDNLKSKVFGDNSTEIVFYCVFSIICTLIIAGFCFPNFRFNKKSFFLLVSSFAVLGLGFFSQYSLDTANSDTKNKVLISEDLEFTSASKVLRISVEAKIASKLLKAKSLSCWILQTKLNPSNEDYKNMSSNELRKNLILNGFDYLVESNYIGIGAGAFRSYALDDKGKRPVQGLSNPHNFVIEILSQYGILVFVLLCYIGFLIIKKCTKDTFQRKFSAIHVFVIGLIVCLLFLGNANSSFLSLPINWLLTGLILIVSNQMIIQNQELDEA